MRGVHQNVSELAVVIDMVEGLEDEAMLWETEDVAAPLQSSGADPEENVEGGCLGHGFISG